MIIFLYLKNTDPLILNAYHIQNVSRKIWIPSLVDHYAPMVPESVHFRWFAFYFKVVKMFFAKRKVKDFIDYGNIKDEKLLKLLQKLCGPETR